MNVERIEKYNLNREINLKFDEGAAQALAERLFVSYIVKSLKRGSSRNDNLRPLIALYGAVDADGYFILFAEKPSAVAVARVILSIYSDELDRDHYGMTGKKGCTLFKLANQFLADSGVLTQLDTQHLALYAVCQIRFALPKKPAESMLTRVNGLRDLLITDSTLNNLNDEAIYQAFTEGLQSFEDEGLRGNPHRNKTWSYMKCLLSLQRFEAYPAVEKEGQQAALAYLPDLPVIPGEAREERRARQVKAYPPVISNEAQEEEVVEVQVEPIDFPPVLEERDYLPEVPSVEVIPDQNDIEAAINGMFKGAKSITHFNERLALFVDGEKGKLKLYDAKKHGIYTVKSTDKKLNQKLTSGICLVRASESSDCKLYAQNENGFLLEYAVSLLQDVDDLYDEDNWNEIEVVAKWMFEVSGKVATLEEGDNSKELIATLEGSDQPMRVDLNRTFQPTIVKSTATESGAFAVRGNGGAQLLQTGEPSEVPEVTGLSSGT